MHVVVIGMGYVGIPCAALFADVNGFRVTGVQRRSRRSGWKIDYLNSGRCPFEGEEPGLAELLHRVAVEKKAFRVTDDYAVCEEADAILIDVQTPIDSHHRPHHGPLREASTQAARHLQRGTLVIIESTVPPGTTQNVVRPILERESGLLGGRDFSLAFSYERVMPGKMLEYIVNFPRVVGGIDGESTRRAVQLYKTIVRKQISATDVLTAEMAKVVENAYRDVNIAFANEVALLCESMGVDAFEMRELINARPDRQMLLPGAGVGGHCLPKDSWLLRYGVHAYGHNPPEMRLIPLAREINDRMPLHMLELIEQELHKQGKGLAESKVAILGVAYLENSDDVRNTPAAELARLLLDREAAVVAHDPYVRTADWDRELGNRHTVALLRDLDEALAGVDCAAIVTSHREYLALTSQRLRAAMRTAVVVDGRNALDFPSGGVAVRTVGRGQGTGID